jgi:hypothetical protein
LKEFEEFKELQEFKEAIVRRRSAYLEAFPG